jgi:hypothetical protein
VKYHKVFFTSLVLWYFSLQLFSWKWITYIQKSFNQYLNSKQICFNKWCFWCHKAVYWAIVNKCCKSITHGFFYILWKINNFVPCPSYYIFFIKYTWHFIDCRAALKTYGNSIRCDYCLCSRRRHKKKVIHLDWIWA